VLRLGHVDFRREHPVRSGSGRETTALISGRIWPAIRQAVGQRRRSRALPDILRRPRRYNCSWKILYDLFVFIQGDDMCASRKPEEKQLSFRTFATIFRKFQQRLQPSFILSE